MNKQNVRVRLIQDTITMKVEVEVGVSSKKKPGLWATLKVDADAPGLEDLVQRTAHACAVHLIVNYRDKCDPDECGKLARECLREIQINAGIAHRRIISFGDAIA